MESTVLRRLWCVRTSLFVVGVLFALWGGVPVVDAAEKPVAFSSCGDLQETLAAAYGEKGGRGGVLEDAVVFSSSEGSDSTQTGGGESDYSKTNVQVEGVDEADIVKTDGKYIYLVHGATIRIVQALPADNLREVAVVQGGDVNFIAQELYVDGDRLTVIGRTSLPYEFFPTEDDGKPRVGYLPYTPMTKVYVYDISNPAQPSEIRHVAFEGSYHSSRKVDAMVYLVMNQYPFYTFIQEDEMPSEDTLVPKRYDSAERDIPSPVASCEEITHLPQVNAPQYLIVASIDTMGNSVEQNVVLGSSETIYATRDHLYVTATNYPDIPYLLTDEDSDEDSDLSMRDPSPSAQEYETTTVYKFDLGSSRLEHLATGEVPGHLLNQFSLDEFSGYLRIATTRGYTFSADQPSTNNVYVLDANLGVHGKLEGLAPGERIYSARFMGECGYLVTFKETDPLFVLDLSVPSTPRVIGELKIPGFSNYLHPIDADHLLGVGKDAVPADMDDASWMGMEFAWYQGMKLAIFDVSEVTDPKVLHQEIIGDRGTDSPLLYDHHALLYANDIYGAGKNLLAFPITVAELSDKQKSGSDPSVYGERVFQGAYVYELSLEDGFDLRGKITHDGVNATDSCKPGMSGDVRISSSDFFVCYPDFIQRILYIGDTLYSTAMHSVGAWDMNTFTKRGDGILVLERDETPPVTQRYEYSLQDSIDFANGYQARWVAQTHPRDTVFDQDGDEYFDVPRGKSITVEAVFENTGIYTWYNDNDDREVAISVYKDLAVQSAPAGLGYDQPGHAKFGTSYFSTTDWASPSRAARLRESVVRPGEQGTFVFNFVVPPETPAGMYREDITLSSGRYWIRNISNGDPLGAAHIWVGINVIE